MPGEDTIEMMKVRAVQGELTDLPEDNPRASFSSRIRALLLRATGIPQLIHLYGALALNKTLALASGENICTTLFSDGTYLYVGLGTSPAKIVKIDLSDFTIVSTLTLNSGENICNCLISDGTYLYAGLGTSPAKIVKIDLSDFTRVSSLTLNIGENICTDLVSDGTYLYAAQYVFPGKITKIYLSDFTIVSTLDLTAGEGLCTHLLFDGSFLYIGLRGGNKIAIINIPTFTVVSSISLLPSDSATHYLASDGTYLYAAQNTTPGTIIKIDLSDNTIVSRLTFNIGENSSRGIIFDGTYLYVGLGTSPAKIVKIDLSDFTRVSSLTFGGGSDECESLFSDGTYIYAGLRTTPGKIVRRYIQPTNASLRERKTDRIYERTVEQSMPLTFYGKVTKYNSTTSFAVSNLSRFGNEFFKNWFVYVVRDAGGAGAAPQDELVKITGYTSSDGTFTHTAFTVDLALNDEVLILHESIASIIINTGIIHNIFDLVNAILTLTETGGTLTTDGTEQNLYINETPAGVFDPKIVQIDFTNQTATETVIIRESYRIKSGGGYIEKDAVTFAGVQTPLLKNVVLEENRFGVKVTMERTAGGAKDYDWEALYKI